MPLPTKKILVLAALFGTLIASGTVEAGWRDRVWVQDGWGDGYWAAPRVYRRHYYYPPAGYDTGSVVYAPDGNPVYVEPGPPIYAEPGPVYTAPRPHYRPQEQAYGDPDGSQPMPAYNDPYAGARPPADVPSDVQQPARRPKVQAAIPRNTDVAPAPAVVPGLAPRAPVKPKVPVLLPAKPKAPPLPVEASIALPVPRPNLEGLDFAPAAPLPAKPVLPDPTVTQGRR